MRCPPGHAFRRADRENDARLAFVADPHGVLRGPRVGTQHGPRPPARGASRPRANDPARPRLSWDPHPPRRRTSRRGPHRRAGRRPRVPGLDRGGDRPAERGHRQHGFQLRRAARSVTREWARDRDGRGCQQVDEHARGRTLLRRHQPLRSRHPGLVPPLRVRRACSKFIQLSRPSKERPPFRRGERAFLRSWLSRSGSGILIRPGLQRQVGRPRAAGEFRPRNAGGSAIRRSHHTGAAVPACETPLRATS